jgi:hypothetical protein
MGGLFSQFDGSKRVHLFETGTNWVLETSVDIMS